MSRVCKKLCLVVLGLLFVAQEANAIFFATSQMTFSIQTEKAAVIEDPIAYSLDRVGQGDCTEQLILSVPAREGIKVGTASNSVQFESLQDEQTAEVTLTGSCPDQTEIQISSEFTSPVGVSPVFILSSGSFDAKSESNVRFLADGNFILNGTFFFPTRGDAITLTGWSEQDPLPSTEQPTLLSKVAGWLVVSSTGWQQFWNSSLTWPSVAAEYYSATGCHTLSEIFLPVEQEEGCIASRLAPLAVKKTLNRLWYGWRDPVLSQLLSIPPNRTPIAGEIRITEVMWAGSFSETLNYSNDEWIELYNTTDEQLSLGTLRLVGVRSGGQSLLLPSTASIAPYSYFVIGKPFQSTLLSQKPDWETSSISISNTGGEIRLETTTGSVLDTLPLGSWRAGENETDQKQRSSAQLRHTSLPGDQWESWTQCDRKDEERCWFVTSSNWKSGSAKNLASPWRASVF